MATADLLTLTLLLHSTYSMGIVTMKEVLKSTVSLYPLPNKNQPLVAMNYYREVACHPSGIYPSTFRGKFLEVTWHEWAKGDHNTCAFARAVHSSFIKFCLGSQGFVPVRIYSMCWRIVPLPSQDFFSVLFIL